MIKIFELDTQSPKSYADGVERLYELAGWSPSGESSAISRLSRSAEAISSILSTSVSGESSESAARAIKNSYCAFGAFDGQKLVGFFRALSDGVSDAYLLDLFVDPEYRGRGIGGELAARIIAKLKGDGIEWITAISTPEAKNLYLRIGKRMKAHVPIRFL